MIRFEFSSLGMVTIFDIFDLINLIENVGKTSIIVTIVSDSFPRLVNKTYHPVIISPDMYMLPINTPTVLLDSSSIIFKLLN